jgi:sigma-E factor negative regulatory protein RseA
LHGEAFARGVQVATSDPLAREAWQNYHLIGDVLRSGELAGVTAPAAFLARLQSRLQQEQPVAAPTPTQGPGTAAVAQRQRAANDGNFLWKLVASVASLAAVAAIGWPAVSGFAHKPDQAQLATASGAAAALANGAPVMMRDPRLDEFMAAHRQLAGDSGLQMPAAGFLRNAAFEGSNR